MAFASYTPLLPYEQPLMEEGHSDVHQCMHGTYQYGVAWQASNRTNVYIDRPEQIDINIQLRSRACMMLMLLQ